MGNTNRQGRQSEQPADGSVEIDGGSGWRFTNYLFASGVEATDHLNEVGHGNIEVICLMRMNGSAVQGFFLERNPPGDE